MPDDNIEHPINLFDNFEEFEDAYLDLEDVDEDVYDMVRNKFFELTGLDKIMKGL